MNSPSPTTVAEAKGATGPASQVPGQFIKKMGRTVHWLWRGSDVIAARARVSGITPRQVEYHRRAVMLLDVARRTLEPVDHLRGGSGAPLAASLYVEASYWLLRTMDPETSSRDALWERVVVPKLATKDPSRRELWPTLERWFTRDWSYAAFAELPEGEQLAAAEQVREFASRIRRAAEEPTSHLSRLLLSRGLRTGTVALLFTVIAGGVWGIVERATRPPDLAIGKPWHTSSTFCIPQDGLCSGVPTLIFFHTLEQQDPWFEYDLGVALPVSGLTVKNRSDLVMDRGIPLIVEISDDQNHYREVARQTEYFLTWKPKFRTQQARYVRLRSPKMTYLHLEEVMVHP